MPSDTLPNDVTSNLALLVIIPVTTIMTVRMKARLCDTFRRMPRQYKVDRHMAIVANLLAYSLFVLWATYLPGDQNSRLELLVAMDLLVGINIQRYLLRVIHSEDTAPYHEPGLISLARRVRRQKLMLALVSLTAASCAATSVAIDYGITPIDHYSGTVKYLFIVIALPAVHSALRTVVLDMQGCRRHSATAPRDSDPTNDFVITDDDDDVL